jgi:hypothetical protein
LLPKQQIEELLSWAHVQAIAGQAGVDLSLPGRDFGVDGTFRPLTVLGSRRFPSGFALDFQLKASTQCQMQLEHVVYDLEVKTYNDLINRNLGGYAIPCILILKVLPADPAQWLESSEAGLVLRGGCYWVYLQGHPSSNKETVRIRIPRGQLLTSDSLLMLLNRVIAGEWLW